MAHERANERERTDLQKNKACRRKEEGDWRWRTGEPATEREETEKERIFKTGAKAR